MFYAFGFAASTTGTVFINSSDFTMSLVVALYFRKCALFKWDLYAAVSAYISNTITCVGCFSS